MSEWTFLTSHGIVLAHIAQNPRSTAREIASASNVTERTTHKIITDLEAEGYIERQRVGRNNFYLVNPEMGLRHETTQEVVVGDLLKVLGWRRRRRRAPVDSMSG